MNHHTQKAKEKAGIEAQLRIQKSRLERRKRDHKLDPTNDAKRHLVSVIQSVVNCLEKELWKYE